MSLEVGDFGAFFRAVHGFDPFPWQQALAERVCRGEWPDVLALPTGSGKTSALDVAVFAMAVDAARPPSERRVPRRAVLVVDRRVVVSQAATHARHIVERVRGGEGILAVVRERLLALTGGEGEPLQWAELRGGMVRDDAWARRPDQPLVASSTVDQVGSRLLFRGYGVGRRMSSVHAGLMGNDVLLLLDEVHLSEPFRQTLEAITRHFRGAERPIGGRFRVVEMSATPANIEQRDVFGLCPKDEGHPVLSARLQASKPAKLDLVKVPARTDEAQARGLLAARCAEHARSMLASGRQRVLVVVNRVDTARLVAQALSDLTCDLVTGRMRPLDRDAWLRRAGPLLTVEGRDEEGPRVVVATQCIEAGADFDFDGLVTECASLDALRQRFGRLDRQGRQPATSAVVVMRSDLVKDDDPVYGDRMRQTWAWLQSCEGPVDFGIQALDRRLRDRGGASDLVADRPSAPVLLPGHLDLWAQTTEHPFPDPDPALFLHGPDRSAPEVQIVWRADLTEGLLSAPDGRDVIADRLSACPPGSIEALSVPLHAAAAWLRRQPPVALADVEGAPADEERRGTEGRPCVRWTGDGEIEVIRPDELRSADTLVVPSSYGGLWRDNWAPEATDPVSDLGDQVQQRLRGRFVRRLLPALLDPSWPPPPSVAEIEASESDGREEIAAWAASVPELAALTDPASVRALVLDGAADASGYLVIRSTRRVQVRPGEAEADEVTTVDDSASFLGRPVPLDEHLGDVQRWAQALATHVGLSQELVEDLALAGWLHDVGKADRRFQQMLAGGSPVRAAMNAGRPLAKSGLPWQNRRAAREARARSGYPRGLRHELQSVVMVEEQVRREAHDPDLVLHLVASHHGWCRPFPPPVVDIEPIDVRLSLGGATYAASSGHALARLDAGVAERFWKLNRRYGWWGLAWLESVLRLADHRASEEKSR